MQPGRHLRARRHADDRLLPPHRGHRRLDLGVDRVRAERRARATRPPGRCAARHPGLAVDGHQRVVERRPVHRDAHHARRRPLPRAPRGTRRRARPSRTSHLRAEHVVDWATRGGAAALGRDDLGQLAAGKKADVVLLKNDDSPVSFPLLNPYGHVAFQAQRGDVHTVLVDGRVVKHEARLVGADLPGVRRAVEATVDHLALDASARRRGAPGMNPDLPGDARCWTTRTSTPTTSPTATPRARAGRMFGEPEPRSCGHRDDGGRWQVAAPAPTSSRRSRAGSTSSAASTRDAGTMTLAEVAAAAGLARPTARRLLLTLEELGFVRVARRRLQPDAEGADARDGVRRRAGPVGHRPPAPGGPGRAHRRVVVDGPARRLRHRLRRPGLGAEDHRAAGGDRHPLPGRADLAGQGAARRAPARRARGRRWPSPAAPACRRTSAAARSSCATSSPRSAPAAGRWPTRSSRPGSARSPSRCATARARCGPP